MNIHFNPRTPGHIEIFGLEIRFYAIFILLAGFSALWITTSSLAKKGYDKNKIANVFYIAFPSGIIGARIWYVIAQWGIEYNFSNFGQVFDFTQGGLAIQGGVIIGIIAGVIAFFHFHKDKSLLLLADVAVPAILLSQSIGRLGNFFNHEVYGRCIASNKLFFLPGFIKENIAPPGVCTTGEYALPLFLIEGLSNLSMFLILHLIVRKYYCRTKYYRNGDFIAFYFIWYGTLRFLLEPMRTAEFIMGSGVRVSMLMSVMFVIIGIFIYLLLRIKTIFRWKSKLVLIDLDGTIIDNNQLIIDAYKFVLSKHFPDKKISKEEELQFLGPPLRVTFSKYTSTNISQLVSEYRQYCEEHKDKNKVFAGSKELLQLLSDNKIPVCLITTKGHNVAIKNLQQFDLDKYFDLIIGGNDIKKVKPSPAGINKAIKHFNKGISFFSKKRIHRVNVVMIGDSQTDILAGKRAFVKTIGVNWSAKLAEIAEVTPDNIISNYEYVVKGLKL